MTAASEGALRRITLGSRHSSPFLEEALRLISAFSGFEVVRAPEGSECDIAYVEDEQACDAVVRIPRVDRYTEANVPRAPSDADLERAVATGRLPFDLFAAMRFWLSDQGNEDAPESSFDRHQRLRPSASAQSRLGLLEIPIVNAYLLSFRRLVARRLAVPEQPVLPVGKRCVVVLTHDVDRPLDPRHTGHAFHLARRSLRERRASALPYLGFALAKAAEARLRDPSGRYWLFPELMREEAKRGFRSTFFFAATSRFAAGAHHLDVGYDVTAARFPDLLKHLTAEGFDIGLHVGYRSGERVERIASERERLSRLAGKDVRGSRHHYWHLGRRFWETLERHGPAGLTHDLSTAFSDAAGFRLGIAFPHRPWNPDANRVVETLEIPTVAMDGAFFYQPSATTDESLRKLEGLIETLKQFEGVAAFDWHQETSIPASARFEKWGRGYLGLLDLLSADPEVSLMTASDVASWASPGSSRP